MKFKVGNKVKVVSGGRMYTTYYEWFDTNLKRRKKLYTDTKAEFKDYNGRTGKIIKIAPHLWQDIILCAVLLSETELILIDEKGLDYDREKQKG